LDEALAGAKRQTVQLEEVWLTKFAWRPDQPDE